MGGLAYMWNPDFAALFESADVASGRRADLLFSISVGFGIIINYASYLRHKEG